MDFGLSLSLHIKQGQCAGGKEATSWRAEKCELGFCSLLACQLSLAEQCDVQAATVKRRAGTG